MNKCINKKETHERVFNWKSNVKKAENTPSVWKFCSARAHSTYCSIH